MIDIHAHIGKIRFGEPWLTAKKLVSIMDKHGISKAVVLPVENPEELDYYVTTDYVLQECSKFRKRLIPFCGIEPRHRYPPGLNVQWHTEFNPLPIIEDYVKRGCRGVGENLAGIPIDDPLNQKLYEVCDKLKLPMIFHIDYWINRDKPGLPNLEKMLKKYRNMIFIMHGPWWWREISSENKGNKWASEGRIKPGGRVEYLLKKYKNIYGDLSAHSGYNAITRDREFGIKFIEENAHKLLFGTDVLAPGQNLPIVNFFKTAQISRRAYELITEKNAINLLKI